MSKVYEYLKDRSGEDGPQHPSECVKTKRVNKKELQSMLEEAIKTMEQVANGTKDIESFKQLTIGYNKIKALIK
jgi:hypothetical protein